MKITKRQLRRIIREEKARILKEQPSRTSTTGWDNFSADGDPMRWLAAGAEQDLPELLRAIELNRDQTATGELRTQYEDDASSLETIYDLAKDSFDARKTKPPKHLTSYVGGIDTIVREQIPPNLYSWIVGEW
jgi:hypothetical protein